jgi:hypothetical protein
MGWHFKGLRISGALTVLSAVLSLVFVFVGPKILSLAFVGLAGYFGAGFMWFTIGKIHEISQERRAKNTALGILIFDNITLVVYVAGLVVLFIGNNALGYLLLRFGVAFLTITFFFCRYAVHVYKTQTSIGAKFAEAPDKQFWVSAEI